MYAIQVDLVERFCLTEMQMGASFRAGGAKDVTIRSLAEARNEYEAALYAEPTPEAVSRIDADQLRLRRAMGVA